jgi:hypothetical protein
LSTRTSTSMLSRRRCSNTTNSSASLLECRKRRGHWIDGEAREDFYDSPAKP